MPSTLTVTSDMAKNWYNGKAGLPAAPSFRSGLEDKIAQQLASLREPCVFEQYFIQYTKPETSHKYTPDFILKNGIIIESKGLFDVEDRKKHLLIQAQHPELDIRFVFSRSASKLYKGAKTTYADWCTKYNFKFADKLIPEEWINEPSRSVPDGVLKAKNSRG